MGLPCSLIFMTKKIQCVVLYITAVTSINDKEILTQAIQKCSDKRMTFISYTVVKFQISINLHKPIGTTYAAISLITGILEMQGVVFPFCLLCIMCVKDLHRFYISDLLKKPQQTQLCSASPYHSYPKNQPRS